MSDLVYTVIRSDRKTIAIQITRDGCVVVRAPRRMREADIARFVEEKHSWVQNHLARIQGSDAVVHPFSKEELDRLAAQAKRELPMRVATLAAVVGVPYGRISIRRQRTRWGSCSAKGNLNFNCLLMLCPQDVRDYVILHELCHRIEMNHSARFWTLVAAHCPSWKNARAWLRTEGARLMRRMGEG